MSEFINNASRREETLKAIIRQLHAGKTVAEVKDDFAELLADVGPDEIVRIEQALVAEGLDPEQIKPLCDVHVAVFRETLDDQRPPDTIPGHPVFTYRAENLGVQRVLKALEDALGDLARSPGAAALQAARGTLQQLREYDKHYLRKENILFPYLERTGFSGPSKVMWAVHDDIRAGWKALETLLAGVGTAAPEAHLDALRQSLERFGPLAHTIREMIYKEEKILFPAALQRLDDTAWAAIREQDDEIGYCYARPGNQWRVQRDPRVAEAAPASIPISLVDSLIPLSVGALTPAQLDLMLKTLPVDVTFVDENDEVRYFSQGTGRIFQRSPAIIGRKVQHCHPPQSVDRVQRILDDFRAGTRDVAAFWIQLHGMFVHIRYFALRDSNGAYRGTLEVSQDLTPLRALEGERRLLDD